MKILNLFAGMGGNRSCWDGDVTAVEVDPDIAAVYAKRFPQDRVVVHDALGYLERFYAEFDFIWASPPCPTHSAFRFNVGVRGKGFAPRIPRLTSLYGTILFLKHHFRGKWVVENVKPYYEYMIQPTIVLHRHPFWANFDIPHATFPPDGIHSKLAKDYADYELVKHLKGKAITVLRNCVSPEIGKHIMEACNA